MQAKKENSANCTISAVLSKDILEAKENEIAKKMAKTIQVDGFRKGKAPLNIVKARYAKQIKDDAVSDLVRETYENGLKELNIDKSKVIGEPKFTKFDEKDDSIELEIKVSLQPEIDITGYEDVIPETKLPEVSDEEVETKIKEYSKEASEPVKIEKAVAEKGDFAVIDFKGFIDGKEMENGSATDYPLELGSNSFIPGFEEQVEGMKVGETKKIKVTFPEDYQQKEIAGKEAEFEVTLKEVRQREEGELNDELAKKLLQKEDATLEELKNSIRDEILASKKVQIFAPKKDELINNLLEKFNFDLPEIVVEEEANIQLNAKARELSEEEIKEVQENEEKLNKLREEAKEEAEAKVKLTFIVNEIAKAEKVDVSDDEVMQAIYFEAIRSGEQDIMKIVEYYKENNLLPAIKMSMVEEKLLNNLLEKRAK